MSNILRKTLSPVANTKGSGRGSNVGFKKSLQVEQDGVQITANVDLSSTLSIANVWLYLDNDVWLKLDSGIQRISPGTTALTFDLSTAKSIAYSGAELPESNSDELLDAETKVRMTVYLEIEGTAEAVPKSAQNRFMNTRTDSIAPINDDGIDSLSETEIARGLVTLGGFLRTALPPLYPIEIAGDTLTPYVTKKGNIAFALNHTVPPFMRVHVDEVTVGKSKRLLLKGRIYTRHTSISDLRLQLTARSTGLNLQFPAKLTFDEEGTAVRYGLNRYWFAVDTPLANFLDPETPADDIFDAWLTAEVIGMPERQRVRVGKNRYLVRRRAKPGTATVGDSAVSVVPYFTMKAKNVSFQVEYFGRRAMSLIDKAVARPRRLRSIARKAGSDRPVWLIGEMPFKAQDTGLSLFKYLIDNHPEIDARYVIDLNSPELVNLAGYEEHVVGHRSEEHVLLSLAANRIVGSHHPDYIYPTRRREFVRACQGLEVFLQHGVMGMKWMTQTYGKSAAGFSTDLFLTSSEREKTMIVQDFGYSPSEVEVTGLSRFDALFDSNVEVRPNQVLILPTWRDWLTSTESFQETRFFEEWFGLLNSPELRDLCDRFELDVVFGLHPNMRQHIDTFSDSPARVFVQGEVSVQTLIKQSGIMITDYSSAGLDFSFLHKPLLYFQFDQARFFGKSGSHFDLSSELPGPVSSTRSALVRQLETLLTQGSGAYDKYSDRADNLYPFRDTDNRARIVRAILKATRSSRVDKLSYSEPVQILAKRLRRNKRYFPAMKRLFTLAKQLPMRDDLVVFESGLGRQYSDSPRALYEELVRRGDTRTKVWIYDKTLPMTDSHTFAIKRLSPKYFWYLARAKYWVNNQNFPFYITRRKNGVYIQTWHGTPLKKMQHDLDNIEGRDAGYLNRVTQASRQWSYLLSPSEYATSAFSTAFRHEAVVLEKGYPRNDILSRPDVHELGESVKQKLDLPTGKKILLYAPTFRDDQNISGNKFDFTLPFDLEEFASKFGDEYLLLLRLHVVVKKTISIPDHLADSVRDVSAYDDINELFLVSDALITDYSSVFFDYAILQRPIIFFAYDLEKYRDQLRGFYLDYNSDLPGPVVTEPAELWNAISCLWNTSEILSAESAKFASKYAPEDDGHAARRVVDTVFAVDDSAR